MVVIGCWLLVVGCWLRIKPVETDDQSMNCLNGVILLGLGFKVWGFGRFLKGLRILKILRWLRASTMKKSPFPRKGPARLRPPGDRACFCQLSQAGGKGF